MTSGMHLPPSPAPLRPVSPEEVEQFRRDGVVALRQIYPDAWVCYLRQAMTEVFERDPAAGMVGGTATGMSETGACFWHEGLRRHHVSGPLPEIVAALTDSSHLADKTYVLSDFVSRNRTFPEIGEISMEGLDPLPPVESDPGSFDIRYFDAEPGDVIVHDWATLHGSTGNVSANAMRRAASVRYAGDDITFLRRASAPEPLPEHHSAIRRRASRSRRSLLVGVATSLSVRRAPRACARRTLRAERRRAAE